MKHCNKVGVTVPPADKRQSWTGFPDKALHLLLSISNLPLFTQPIPPTDNSSQKMELLFLLYKCVQMGSMVHDRHCLSHSEVSNSDMYIE